MIDCSESDNMIEICGKLDKLKTQNWFRGMIFHSFIPKNFFKLFQIL